MAQVYARLYLGDPELLKDLDLAAGNGLPLADANAIQSMCDRFVGNKFELITSPKVLSNPGQEAEIRVQNQISFIADWSVVSVFPGPIDIVDPEIETMAEGMMMQSRVLQIGPDSYGLDLNIEYSKVRQPIPTRTMQVGEQELMVSTPELRTSQIETKLILPGGGGVLFRLPNRATPGDELFLVLEFQPVKLK